MPEFDDFTPTGTGEAPLAKADSWVTEEVEGTRFNTGISATMEFVNMAYRVIGLH